MKKIKLLSIVSLSLLSLAFLFTACKKRQDFKDEDGQSSIDNRNAISENDVAIKDANDLLLGYQELRGKSASTANTYSANICGASIDTLGLHAGTIKVNYNGTTCYNRTRTGSIKLTIVDYANGKRWKQVGSVVKVEFLGYKVTRASDGLSIQLDGTQNITNESGGTWLELIFFKTQSSLVTSLKGTSLKATFEDGKSASYNINRKFTYTYPNNILTCTGEGIGSLNGVQNLENYGLTREGDEFTSQVTTPLVWNITCGPWAPVQGEVNIKVDSRDFDLKCTFAVGSDGNSVVSGANSCPYGWKVEWKYKKKTGSKIIPYS